jgi:hypothetical protein
MPLTLTDLKLYGSAQMPDNNTPTNIGGAIALTKKVSFADFVGSAQLVSGSSGDTTQTVQLFYRDPTGALLNETKTVTGTTPVLYMANIDRLMKGIKSATSGGPFALENQTATRQNTAQAGGANGTIILDAGASAVNSFYNGQVIRLISGTGAFQINEIIEYNGTTKVASLRDYWHGSLPDATTVFRVAPGFFFDKLPNEVLEVRRVFYDTSSNALGGGQANFYDKVFFQNASNVNALLTAQVVKAADPSGNVAFGLEATVNGTGDNGANNRTVAPAGISFATTPVWVPNSTLNAGSSIGVWLRLQLAEAAPAQKTSVTMQLTGSTT